MPRLPATICQVTSYLLVIGDREALGWILSAGRTAFPSPRRSEVRSLNKGDELFLYTTRNAFKNPIRDRGRVIGTARVDSKVAQLERPIRFGDREFPIGCDLEIGPLARLGKGVELAPLVPRLEAFAEAGQAWSIRLRKPLVRLSKGDATLLRRELVKAVKRGNSNVDAAAEYSQWFSD
jgi:hypothetical protein